MKPMTLSNYTPARYIRYVLGVAVVCLTGFSHILPAARAAKPANTGDADIKVSGTSNLHDWTMEAKDISCLATFNFLPGDADQPKSLTALTLSVPVQQLKSGKSAMDSKAYTALQAKKYNEIVFTMTAATIVPGAKDHFQVKTTGNLSIAGVTKPVTMDVTGVVNANGTITCNGSEKLKMSDFQIKPPVFMLGALKTGDALTIDFTVIVKK